MTPRPPRVRRMSPRPPRVPRRFAMEEFDKINYDTGHRIEEDMLEHSLAWGGRV